MADDTDSTPILFAYDGSDEAKAAIREAGRQLKSGRRAIVLTVWEPMANVAFAGVGGVPPVGLEESSEEEARRLAAEGARLARRAGFEAEPTAERGDPVWQRIVESAGEHHADVIVMGSHGRTGIPLVVMGSVAAATARHTDRPVLIAHDQSPPHLEHAP
jgi:nucleotide-binding universal stress UspA family protein